MTTTPTVVFIYGRASSDPDDLRISVDGQLKKGRRYAANTWPNAEVREFRDDNITAADKGVVRPDFERMLRELRLQPKGTVAIWANEQSRLTRLGETSWEDLRVIFNMAGLTEVHTSLQGIVGIAPGNSLAGRLFAVIDSEFAERIKVKVQERHAELFDEGRPSGGIPFGYRAGRGEDKRPILVRDADEVEWVRKIFASALEGHALKVIADKLNAAGVEPRAATYNYKRQPDRKPSTTWGPQTVRSLLRSPTVAGLRAHRDADGTLHTTKAKWDGVVDVDTWRRAQRMLDAPATVIGSDGQTYRVRTMPKGKPRRHLLSGGRRRSGIKGQTGELYGVLRCGKCGLPMIAQTQGRRDGSRVAAYACHTKLTNDENPQETACGGVSISPADEVERLIVDTIQRELAANPTLRNRLSASQDADAARWRAERDEAKARMLDASARYGARAIDADEYEAIRNPAKADYDVAVAQLDAMSDDLKLPSAEDIIERWDDLTLAQQRGVVERLIERIEIAPGNRGTPGFNPERIGVPVWRA